MTRARVFGNGLLILGAFVCALPPAWAAEAPDWMLAAMKAPAATQSRSRRVVLLEEIRLDVSRASRQMRAREAVKLLDTDFQVPPFKAPQKAGDKFKLVGAWRVRPNGSAEAFDAKSIVQIDADKTYQFSSKKVNVFLPQDLQSGDVIGWEYVITSPVEAYTTEWFFGGFEPTSISRFALKIPDDWEVRASVLNHPGLNPATDDEGYRVWEMRSLGAIPIEPFSETLFERVPGLMVSYGPKDKDAKRKFDTWESFSRWYADVVSRQTVSDQSIKELAAKLKGKNEGLAAIRAVAEFTQGVRYLDTAVGRSVFEPHPASDVLRNRFGDCEDKAVLTITLLREIGVEAFGVLSRTREAGPVAAEFPYPQFNHAIVAVRVPENAQLASSFDAGPLGRLAAFDPTDSTTALGDLSASLQGTLAVVAHPTSGGLVSLPMLPPESSERRSEIRVDFAESKGVDVRSKIAYTGQYASAMKAIYGETRGAQRSERLLTWLKSNYGDGRVKSMKVVGDAAPHEDVVEEMEYWMPLPGKDLGDLRTIDVGVGLSTRADRLPAGERTSRIVLNDAFVETSRTEIVVPAEWHVTPPLPAAESTSEAGNYKLTVQQDGDRVIIARTLEVKAARIAPSAYAAVRSFFDAVARGDSAEIVLEKGAAPAGSK